MRKERTSSLNGERERGRERINTLFVFGHSVQANNRTKSNGCANFYPTRPLLKEHRGCLIMPMVGLFAHNHHGNIFASQQDGPVDREKQKCISN